MGERAKTRERVATWPLPGTAGRKWNPWFTWPVTSRSDAVHRRIRAWLVLDTAPGRLIPWLPVAFGAGIAAYFAADHEPALWAATSASAACLMLAVLVRRRPIAFPLALGALALAAGFAIATIKTWRLAHPVLQFASTADVSGFVAVREERERSDRIIVEVAQLEGSRIKERLERIRVSVRKGTAPAVGTFVEFKARLSPPVQMLQPGGYDFARNLWFQRVSATGFVLGSIKIREPPRPVSRSLRFAAFVEGLRDGIDARIRAAVPGDAGSIASALITGKRDAISAPVTEAMYVSSLAHVLSISGYHMALVAGVVFFVVRGLLALSAPLATRYPIKKWSAVAALCAAACYLVLSGGEVATQRAFIMTAVVLGGVLVDRPALTLRTLAVAAVVVLLTSPQAVVHPSFQMSFAAALALVCAYERGLPWAMAAGRTSLGARVALWGGRQIATLAFASMIAGLATTLFAAYHFHRLAPYGVIANLLGMPIVSILVMPAGLVALLAMPFGFDAPLWHLMGEGIAAMIAVASWVASLPGAVGRITAFGTGALLLATLGLLLICLLRSPLRWCGIALLGAAILIAWRTPSPDVLVSFDGSVVAVRGPLGRLSVMKSGTDSFAIRAWLSADADGRAASDPTLADGTSCDGAGCIAPMWNGTVIALALRPEAFDDDCVRAGLIVTRHAPPLDCRARVLDRSILSKTGSVSLMRLGSEWQLTAARPPGYERPWARAPTHGPSALSPGAPPVSTRDATPRAEDLEPGD